MDIRVVPGDIAHAAANAIVVNLFEGVTQPGGASGAVDRAMDGALGRLIADGEIRGRLHHTTIIHTLGKIPARKILVIGLGRAREFSLDRIRTVSAEACRVLRRSGAERIATIVHGAGIGGIDPEAAAQALTEGALLGTYIFRRYKSRSNEDEQREIRELLIVEGDQSKIPALERGVARGRIIAEAANFCRDLANEPANMLTPQEFAERAAEKARDAGLDVNILEPTDMRRLGMGALLAVGQGSPNPPRLIELRYRGAPEDSAVALGLLGKGITFDSGGISIKAAQGMEDMKGDMAGGAAAISATIAIAQLGPHINVTCIVPTAENMPDGSAVKPGDVVRAMNGKTIEVINTDAEGRMVLADGLSYARSQGISRLVDAATLTGAAVAAVGPFYTGAMTNNQEFLNELMKAADQAGELVWQLPMRDDYKELIRSDVADMKNTGGRAGGAITAAQLLAEFAEDTPWVHLDIAPTAQSDKVKGYTVKGASGVMVRTMVNLALNLAAREEIPSGRR